MGPPPRRLLEPSWRPRGPRRPPRAVLAPFWHHLGSNLGGFLEHFGALFWSHSPFALAILAPFWEPKWSPEASFLELLCNTLGLYFPPIRRPSNAVRATRQLSFIVLLLLFSQASRLCWCLRCGACCQCPCIFSVFYSPTCCFPFGPSATASM